MNDMSDMPKVTTIDALCIDIAEHLLTFITNVSRNRLVEEIKPTIKRYSESNPGIDECLFHRCPDHYNLAQMRKTTNLHPPTTLR